MEENATRANVSAGLQYQLTPCEDSTPSQTSPRTVNFSSNQQVSPSPLPGAGNSINGCDRFLFRATAPLIFSQDSPDLQ